MELLWADDIVNQQLSGRPPQHTGQTMQRQQHDRVPHFQNIEHEEQAPRQGHSHEKRHAKLNHSPWIESINVVRRGRVRRAKLYYLRGLRGKAARIAERTDARARALKAAFKGFKKPKGPYDDLKRIKGVDEQLAKKLASINVLKFEKIANFSDDEIAQIDETLKLKGRIERDDWIGQAKQLLAEATADEVPAESDGEEAGDDQAAEGAGEETREEKT